MELGKLAKAMETAFEKPTVRTEVANCLSRGRAQNEIVKRFRTHGGLNVIGEQGTATVGHQNPPVEALVRFKLWMAADILELVQERKLNLVHPTHGIYGAYKEDYDALVEARNQWPNNQVPLTASCTLVYFINPAGAQPVQPFPQQVNAGVEYLRDHPNRCQVSSAIGHFLGMLDVKRQHNVLPRVQPTSIVTHLMTTTATHYPPAQNGAALPANEQHTITLAAVWTEIR